MPAHRLTTLGRVSCTTDGVELTSVASQPRRVALLIYLVLAEPRGFHSRDQLLALFWPDYDEQRARNALSQAVHFLRRSLGANTLANGGDDQLRVDPELLWCDVIAFEAALAAGRTADAVALYRGPFLEGFHISSSTPELDQWVASERDRLGRLFAGALQRLAEDAEAGGDLHGAVTWCRRLAALDPLSPRGALGLMRALANVGDYQAALQHGRVHATISRAELDAPADPAITQFANELRQRIGSRTPNADDRVGITRAESGLEKGPANGVEISATPSIASPSLTSGRRKRQAVIALFCILGGSLALVPLASRRSADATPRIGCVAVLPVDNLSGDSTLHPFVEAMTAAVTTELGHYEGFEVKSRSSVLALPSAAKPLREIGRALDCAGLVQASLTRNGPVAHVDAQILYASGDRVLWADSFEDDTSRLLVLERRVINTIARQVRALAGQAARTAGPKRRVDSLAYSAYLRGRDEFRSWNALSLRLAVALYQQAIVLDSTFAPAYAGLADAYNLIGWQGYGAPEYLDSARTLAEQALALDSASSEAHTTNAFILASDADWTHAEAEFKVAIGLDENNALAHQWYAVLLAILNRKDAAFREIRRAHDLDPTSQEIQGKLVALQFFSGAKKPLGNPGRLQAWADPNHPAAWATRAVALARKGQCAEAARANQTARELAPDNTMALVGLVLVQQSCKDSTRANALLAKLKRRRDARLMAVYIALPHVAARQPDSAFAWLDRSRGGMQTYWMLRVEPMLDPLRTDPRFSELLQRLRLP